MFCRERGVPIDEGNGEVVSVGAKPALRERFRRRLQRIGNVKFISAQAPRSGWSWQSAAVEPHVGAVVDPFEFSQDSFPL